MSQKVTCLPGRQVKSQSQNTTRKIIRLACCLCAAVMMVFCSRVYALNLDKLKIHFLNGDYKAAILEGEKILARVDESFELDELYYTLALSYMKDGNLLRASDIFEIILKELKGSNLKEEANLGLGDTYFLRGDFTKAQDYYKELISANPNSKFKAEAYYRLSQIGFKTGQTQQAKEYLDRLREEFPLNPELTLNKDLYLLSDSPDIYYTVQVGAFSDITNANNLTQKLIQNGYPAYVEETDTKGKTAYRVRVGKSRLRQEIVNLERKLSAEGYPTKVFP